MKRLEIKFQMPDWSETHETYFILFVKKKTVKKKKL